MQGGTSRFRTTEASSFTAVASADGSLFPPAPKARQESRRIRKTRKINMLSAHACTTTNQTRNTHRITEYEKTQEEAATVLKNQPVQHTKKYISFYKRAPRNNALYTVDSTTARSPQNKGTSVGCGQYGARLKAAPLRAPAPCSMFRMHLHLHTFPSISCASNNRRHTWDGQDTPPLTYDESRLRTYNVRGSVQPRTSDQNTKTTPRLPLRTR